MNKNIDIVTWMGSGNYGTSLQAFSLHYYLEKRGYRVYITSFFPEYTGIKSHFINILDILGIMSLRNKWRDRNESLKHKKIQLFKSRYLNIPRLITKSQRTRFVNNMDVFISGSDQIWNTYYRFDPFMFLDIKGAKRKVAYASSIGTNSINTEYDNSVKKLLLDFDRIGVREKDAVDVLTKLTGRQDIVQVVDPTFLINDKEWREIIKSTRIKNSLPEKYILCYLVGAVSNYASYVNDIRQLYGIKNVIVIPSEENPSFFIDGAYCYNDADPIEFVKLIEQSTLVCTDSFHATSICINLKKDFIVFLRFKDSSKESQNSRIYNLLSHYGLMNRIYIPNKKDEYPSLDYSRIQEVLFKDRIFSESYLIDAIENDTTKK